MFFPDLDPYPDDGGELSESQQFSAQYWELLSPVLTTLHLCLEDELCVEDMNWLCSLQQLQHLDIHGLFSHPLDISLPGVSTPQCLCCQNVPVM